MPHCGLGGWPIGGMSAGLLGGMACGLPGMLDGGGSDGGGDGGGPPPTFPMAASRIPMHMSCVSASNSALGGC